ncbi:M23 family metallopeptidase [Cellulomonas citrea]|uniref:M23 family metallopeptidase n=1 Tax=Cellulomonas citrea TaxID=1909423 RepID=UPI00135BD2CD|nr:M23 family metallopeptidase [Cellulomonas citrea]
MPSPLARTRRAFVAAVVAAVTLLGAATPAGADDLDNRRKATQDAINANQQKQAQLQDAVEELQGSIADAGAQLVQLQGQLPAAQQAVDTATASYQSAQREADLIAARLADAEQQETQLTDTIATDTAKADQVRATIAQIGREAYRNGADVSGLAVVLAAKSPEDFVEGYAQMSAALRSQTQSLSSLQTLAAQNKAAQNRLSAVKDKITDLKAQADAKVAEAATAKKAAADAKAQLDALTAQVSAQQTSLEAQKADIEAQLAAADAASDQLKNDLAAIIAQQQAAGKPASAIVSGAVFGNPTVHAPMVVTSEYGMRWQPILHIYRLHAGLDLRSYCGEEVYAGRAGTVQWAMFRSGYGNQVMIDHGWVNGASTMSSYSHLTRAVVSAGQQVQAGQLVGYAGATGGISTGCHLHFEVYINGSTVNPRPYLGL